MSLHELLGRIRVAGEREQADPVIAPLLGLVREICQGQDLRDAPTFHGKRYLTGESCCDGTLFITRTRFWGAAPDGALEGALQKALYAIMRVEQDMDALNRLAGAMERLVDLISQEGDTREAACRVALEWLEAVSKARRVTGRGVR
ncbi:hypothetical protein LCGC14_1048920 [marine sediment metagenome]|uniref:Uncharacterized protein n=1 Tax=marine sediment metagenome TaxID=412755 RepID=A0A0F9NB85_9ZZZZ